MADLENRIREEARNMAVDFYDGLHGYTWEFAPHPDSHRLSYDFWEEKFAERITALLASSPTAADLDALLPTEDATAAVANAIAPMLYGAAFKDLNGDYQIDCRAIANVAITAMRALAKPDEGVVDTKPATPV